MAAARKIKVLLAERGKNLTQLSAMLGKSLSTMSGKMHRDNFSEKDLREIAEALNFEYDIVFIDKETGKEIR